ncbi:MULTISPECIES: MvdC/MvdD family ATP grasp protein [unclassified Streptosporangium]|uniref:MvdC/MvdD family ATP grasp protein n=1 Tax=Streptosporangium sp. NPDC005286 TaxID=3154463 RepID=UPI0033AE6553
MILILSAKSDAGVNLVLPKLVERGLEVYWWDPGDYPSATRITSRLVNGTWRHTLVTDDAEIDSSDISTVWVRRPEQPQAASTVENPDYRDFVKKIGRIYLDGWEETLDARWFPARMSVLMHAQNKLVNLAAGARLGFTVPETTFTNDPEGLAEAWAETEGRLIAKEVEFVPYQLDGRGHSFYTTPLTRRHLTSRHRLAHAPVILQPRIEKATELRITVVGEQVFTVEIHSQGSRMTREDFRHYEGNFTEYAVHDLPKDVERRCVELVRSLNLAFGCIDVIVTPEGEYVYLELNPNGQWGWLEEFTDLRISDAVADWLAAGEPAVREVTA